MNINLTSASNPSFFYNNTSNFQPPVNSTVSQTQAGLPGTNQSATIVAPTMYTSTLSQPSSITATSTSIPQQLDQNPLDLAVSFLLSSDVMEGLANKNPVVNLFRSVMSIWGLKPDSQNSSVSTEKAVEILQNLINQSRPNLVNLRTQVSQFIDEIIKGQAPSNPLIESAHKEVLSLFEDEINETGGLIQLFNSPELRIHFEQNLLKASYHSYLIMGVFKNLQSSPLIQNLIQNDPVKLSTVLRNLMLVVRHQGAPTPEEDLVRDSSQAIVQMMQSIFNNYQKFKSQMGITDPVNVMDSRAVHPSVLKDQPVSN
jgi:hypothetical protein